MIHDEDFDLRWADQPPPWMEGIGPLMEYWGNPIFQRRYVLWRLKPAIGVRNAWLLGLAISLLLNLLFHFVAPDKEESMLLGLFITIVAPGVVVIAITSVRMFVSSIVATPLELRRELFSDSLGAVLSTPLSDRDIFFSECTAGIMRGLGAVEEVLALLGGLLFPFLVINFPYFRDFVSENGIQIFWGIIGLVLLAIIIAQSTVLAAIQTAANAILFPLVAAIMTTSISIGATAVIPVLLVYRIFSRIFESGAVTYIDPLLFILAILVAEIITFTIATSISGRIGVGVFARARRPGFYEDEGVTAAGLQRREADTSYSFGKRV